MNYQTETILKALYKEGTKFREEELARKGTSGIRSAKLPLVVAEPYSSLSFDEYTREVKGDNLYFNVKTEPIFVYKPEADRLSLVQDGEERKSWSGLNLDIGSGYYQTGNESTERDRFKESIEAHNPFKLESFEESVRRSILNPAEEWKQKRTEGYVPTEQQITRSATMPEPYSWLRKSLFETKPSETEVKVKNDPRIHAPVKDTTLSQMNALLNERWRQTTGAGEFTFVEKSPLAPSQITDSRFLPKLSPGSIPLANAMLRKNNTPQINAYVPHKQSEKVIGDSFNLLSQEQRIQVANFLDTYARSAMTTLGAGIGTAIGVAGGGIVGGLATGPVAPVGAIAAAIPSGAVGGALGSAAGGQLIDGITEYLRAEKIPLKKYLFNKGMTVLYDGFQGASGYALEGMIKTYVVDVFAKFMPEVLGNSVWVNEILPMVASEVAIKLIEDQTNKQDSQRP